MFYLKRKHKFKPVKAGKFASGGLPVPITLKPQSRRDYLSAFGMWISKKLLFIVCLLCCAGIFTYFLVFAGEIGDVPDTVTSVLAPAAFMYDDMRLADYTGVASIMSADSVIVYTGDVKDGICSGNGTLYGTDGKILYTGGFERNKYEGHGTSYYRGGNIKYEGEYSQNRYNGEGSLYSDDGRLIYDGTFKDGKYDRHGREYTGTGKLKYEGAFLDGLYSGLGILYYEDGTTNYSGEFYAGKPQGSGKLYNSIGKLVYNGPMYDGEMNCLSLLSSTLEDIRSYFTETPVLFYTNNESCFVFEQAGVIVTTDSKVRVSEWERPRTGSEDYFMPGELDDNQPQDLPGDSEDEDLTEDDYDETEDDESGDEDEDDTVDIRIEAEQVLASIIDFNFAESYSDSGEDSTEDPSETSTYPDFIKKNLTIYYEVDKNIWMTEDKLLSSGRMSMIKVKKVTVYEPGHIPMPEDAQELDDTSPPAIEDCVSIDYIRKSTPTAFSNVVFEIDRQNRLYLKVNNISYAGRIVRRAYEKDGIVYKYCYQMDDTDKIMYYSVAN